MEQASSSCPHAVWHIMKRPVLTLGMLLPSRHGLCLLFSKGDCKASAAALMRGLMKCRLGDYCNRASSGWWAGSGRQRAGGPGSRLRRGLQQQRAALKGACTLVLFGRHIRGKVTAEEYLHHATGADMNTAVNLLWWVNLCSLQGPTSSICASQLRRACL